MYRAEKLSDVQNAPDTWNSVKYGVFQEQEQVGEFQRNYDSYGDTTFVPFKRGDNWYALYSPHYTGISVMELPSCKLVGGEPEDEYGFCPVEIYIPRYQIDTREAFPPEELLKYPEQNRSRLSQRGATKEYDEGLFEEGKEIFYENFAFVSGCVWGDDSSWKIELRDISQAHVGIIKRVDEWGYHQLPGNLSLKECVRLSAFEQRADRPQEVIDACIAVTKTIRLNIDGDIKLKFFD